MMNQIYPFYIGLWAAGCVVAAVFYFKEREAYAISYRTYWRFISAPWKLSTFVIATAGLTVIAPYTGDPTWDYCDALVMSVLTFITAPWVVGVMYRAVRRQIRLTQVYVAFCMWMFTTSWFYDTYILVRDGSYPQTWLPNILASSALYIFGGLLWNLDWVPERGTIFAFMERDWPPPAYRPVFHRVIWFGLIFIILVALMMLPFILDEHLDVNSWFANW